MIKKQFLVILSIIILPLFWGWGRTGHYKISYNASHSFNEQMNQFNAWTSLLASHASDADNRKPYTPDEGPKHYIDIDNYSDFIQTGRIPQTLDSVISIYGSPFVYAQGILPWAMLTSYDSLTNCFIRKDWDQAMLFASDLGHYVADGHMPLHLTRNYNGQYSDNVGIHYRYESTMINSFDSQINYAGEPIDTINNINEYVFQFLYNNYTFVDSVIAADDSAKSINSDYYSTEYKEALWDQSEEFTTELFRKASHAITELIFTAWIQAGSPIMNDTGLKIPTIENSFSLEQNAPNPFSGITKISFNMAEREHILLEVRDVHGRIIKTIIDGEQQKGKHEIFWQAGKQKNGIYYVVLSGKHKAEVRKMIVLN